MSEELAIEAIATGYVRDRVLSNVAQRVLGFLAGPGGGAATRADLWGGSGENVDERTLIDLTGFLVEFIARCLSDHSISANEQASIRRLKHLLRVEEGDLLQCQKQSMTEILAAEMGLILYDRIVDAHEAVHQVDLQVAFDLSYDQWLDLMNEFIRPIVQEFIDKVMADGVVTPTEREGVLRRLSSLNTVMKIDLESMSLPWGEAAAEGDLSSVARGIPTAVKDAVWRRDEGRCAQCRSQSALEFDHIIPFSRGGASTYRNVQLLCQTCNRSKAARIGDTVG